MIKLVMRRTDVSDTTTLEPWATSTTEDLQYIEDGKVYERAFRTIVNLSTLDDDCMALAHDQVR